MWAVEWPCDRDGPILNRKSASAQPHRRIWESGAGVEADGYQYKVSPTSVSHKLLLFFHLTFSSINNGIDLLLPSVLFATPRMMMMMMMTVLEVREGRNRDSINQSIPHVLLHGKLVQRRWFPQLPLTLAWIELNRYCTRHNSTPQKREGKKDYLQQIKGWQSTPDTPHPELDQFLPARSRTGRVCVLPWPALHLSYIYEILMPNR